MVLAKIVEVVELAGPTLLGKEAVLALGSLATHLQDLWGTYMYDA